MGTVVNYYTFNGRIVAEEQVAGYGYRNYGADALGSVVATYANGEVQDTFAYSPYGNMIVSQVTESTPYFIWCGTLGYRQTSYHLPEFYVRARHYSGALARWTTVDPLLPAQPPYLYAGSNPSSLADPPGTQPGNRGPETCFGDLLNALKHLKGVSLKVEFKDLPDILDCVWDCVGEGVNSREMFVCLVTKCAKLFAEIPGAKEALYEFACCLANSGATGVDPCDDVYIRRRGTMKPCCDMHFCACMLGQPASGFPNQIQVYEQHCRTDTFGYPGCEGGSYP